LKQQVGTYSPSGSEKQNTRAIKRKTAAYRSQQNQATRTMMCNQVTATTTSVRDFFGGSEGAGWGQITTAPPRIS